MNTKKNKNAKDDSLASLRKWDPIKQPNRSRSKRDCPPKTTDKLSKADRKIEKFKNINFSRHEEDVQLSVHNLEFPDTSVKRTELHKRDECGERLVTQKGNKDFSHSSNSHFRDCIETVNVQRSSCSKSSVVTASSSKSSRSSRFKPHLNSEDMIDSEHRFSDRLPNFRGKKWSKPCEPSLNIAMPKSNVNTCPTTLEQLAKLPVARQKFFLTQDPRKTHCIGKPMHKSKITSKQDEYQNITKMVKHAENICVGSESETSNSYICEVIDRENPMNLDFQGTDYKINFEKDEQELQNSLYYWRILRFMERKRVKKITASNVENELQAERLAIPPAFATTIRDEEPKAIPIPKLPHLSELYRSVDKPINSAKIETEKANRTVRYKDIYLRNKARKEEQERERKKQEAAAKEVEAMRVAQEDLHHDVAIIDDAIERSFRKQVEIKKVVRQRMFFPKTLDETIRMKKKMHKDNCIRRDKARVEQQFFLERTGKLKKYPDAELNVECDKSLDESLGTTPSEQSSDDEDYLQVGKIDEHFQLRGFHYKHGDGMRGKFHRHQIMQGQRTVKGCLTRDEWLRQLAPKKEPVKLHTEVGILKIRDPDDPNLDLFPKQPITKPHHEIKSAIKEYKEKSLGLHYQRVIRKNLKLVKPKLKYHVKKFNLIRYVFPEKPMQYDTEKKDVDEVDLLDPTKVATTAQYMQLKARINKAQLQKKKMARIKLLGLPCPEAHELREISPCDRVDSDSDGDWVPTPEPPYEAPTAEQLNEVVEEKLQRLKGGKTIPLDMRGNMPAPKFREKILVIHPRRMRDYSLERVPSVQFEDAVKNSGLPIVEKISPDAIDFADVRKKKRPYSSMFEARHHHDHWKPTHTKHVHVHYQMNVVEPKTTEEIKVEKVVIENFVKANPPCKKYFDVDTTLPKYDIEKMITDHLKATRHDTKTFAREVVQNLCHPFDFIFHSRSPEELAKMEFPGRRSYLEFLRTTREAIYGEKVTEEREERLLVDREQIVTDLEEDLKSIEECLTSLSSSECTNLTNDSGSFLLIDGKTKLPMDYMRKPLVPFEELHRTRYQAEVIDAEAEDENPYRMLPFSGQHKDQFNLFGGKDTFFTFNTRLRNSMRLRLEVPIRDVRKTLIGAGNRKYKGAVITDLDENYIEELKSRATVKNFNFKTGIELVKPAMRLKYESLLIQGQMVRTKIYDRMNERHWQDMKNTKLLYEALFAKWEKKEYNAAMTLVYQVKSYYETTDALKREYRDLERELMMLNMDIVFTEGHWIRCIMLQNFHYLMGEHEWRLENDWIHKVPKNKVPNSSEVVAAAAAGSELVVGSEEEDIEYTLERYDESIAKRATVNIRVRDKDDAWAIRTFYYNVYMRNIHPILQVFPDAESFLQGVENLKNNTFVLLLEMHFTLALHTELRGKLETFLDWCAKDLMEKKEYVARKSTKKFFMEHRAMDMEKRVQAFLGHPLEESFADVEFNQHRGIIAEVWRRVVPANVRGSSDITPGPCEMVASISEVAMEIFAKFEHMDIEKVREVETALRKRRAYLEKVSAQAYHVERRIDSEMKKVRRNLEPPYVRPKREGKLPRQHLRKKRKSKELLPVTISEHTKFFMRAFKPDDEETAPVATTVRNSLMVVENMQESIVPFYFDHFLKTHGYTPNYNFKTNVDQRDGPEINRFRILAVIPDVVAKVEQWEITRKRIMEENIQKHPKMYDDFE